MSVKVTDYSTNIANDTKQKASIFLRVIADRIISDARPKTPRDKGNLSRDTIARVLALHGEIEWRKSYATYQERGRRADGSHVVRKYTTPGTGPHFAENAVQAAVKDTPIVARLANLV